MNSTDASLMHAAQPSRRLNIALWILQGLMAAVFLQVGSFKLAGVKMMVHEFDMIGVGQWFRYVTGCVEVAGAILLLIPRTATLGGLLLAVTMTGAIAARFTVLSSVPGPPILEFLLFLSTAAIAWGRRKDLTGR